MTRGIAGHPAVLMMVALTVTAGCDSSTILLPPPTPMEVAVTPDEIVFDAVGATETLSATVLDENGDAIPDAPVTWHSSNEWVAVVDEEGVVESIGEGVATITAISEHATGTSDIFVELED